MSKKGSLEIRNYPPIIPAKTAIKSLIPPETFHKSKIKTIQSLKIRAKQTVFTL